MVGKFLALVALAASTNAYLQVPIQGVGNVRSLGKSNFTRRDVLVQQLDNSYFYYQANIGIGTPAQDLQVQVDTGSSDLWVMLPTNPFCNGTADDIAQGLRPDCSSPIIFNPNISSTYTGISGTFDILYGDYSYAKGNWGRDSITISDVEITNATFAVASESNSTLIVMGIGFDQDESEALQVNHGRLEPTYSNIPMLLKEQGHITTNAYSLWLDDTNSFQGSLMFGGVDHTKYQGTLTLVPIINLSRNLTRPFSMDVMLHGVSASIEDGTSGLIAKSSWPVLLDSGTSFAYLPSAMAASMANVLDFSLDNNTGMYTGSCTSDALVNGGFFTFDLSGIEIEIPFSEFVTENYEDNMDSCSFLVLNSDDAVRTILGDVFLRFVYVVYDLDNYQIALAPARYNQTDSDIEPIDGKIPRATTAASYYSTIRAPDITTYALSNGSATSPVNASSVFTMSSIVSGPAAAAKAKSTTIIMVTTTVTNSHQSDTTVAAQAEVEKSSTRGGRHSSKGNATTSDSTTRK